MTSSLVLVVAGDPGGANALLPVIKQLMRIDQIKTKCLSYYQATGLWESNGINSIHLEDGPNKDSVKALLLGADVLLTATSCNELNWEIHLIKEARIIGIFVVSLLDFWSNYRERFLLNGCLCQPDVIAIMDDYSKAEMIGLGFDASHLEVTGHPVLEAIKDRQRSWSAAYALREKLGISRSDVMIVFVSQPLIELYRILGKKTEALGYDELQVFSMLCELLRELTNEIDGKVTLLVLPHPREQTEKYQKILDKRFSVFPVLDIDRYAVAMAADAVVGMTSMFLVEICYLGGRVISFQPGLAANDILPTNRMGWSVPVYKKKEFLPTLKDLLREKDYEGARYSEKDSPASFTPTDAVKKIVNLILSAISKRGSNACVSN